MRVHLARVLPLVRHRIDGLEIEIDRLRASTYVRHRIDGLESQARPKKV